jgi:hypothetical protein
MDAIWIERLERSGPFPYPKGGTAADLGEAAASASERSS